MGSGTRSTPELTHGSNKSRVRAVGWICSACVLALSGCEPNRATTPNIVLRSPQNASRIVVVPNAGTEDNFIRGVHYFTGWRTPDPDFYDPNLTNSDKPREFPWLDIQNFNGASSPDRVPRLGWYNDSQQADSDAQILAMVDAGYDYVIYQVNWSHKKWGATDSGMFRGHTVENHVSSAHASRLKFSVMWHDVNSSLDANLTQPSVAASNYWLHELRRDDQPWTGETVREDFTALFSLWFRDYASNQHFHFHNGRPVVFFFDPETLRTPQLVLGGTTPSARGLIQLLRSVAALYGFSGATTPYVVGQNVPDVYVDSLRQWGFDAHSGYVYNTEVTYDVTTGANFANAFALYRGKWNWALSRSSSSFMYWVPNAPGSDSRPWNGAYRWTATAPQFEALVRASMDTASARASVTGRNLITCCWNEWGEGPSVEPWTMDPGSAYKGSELSDAHRHTVVGGGNQLADGNFDDIEPGGYAWGWAVDPDTPNSEIHVHFYADGPYGQGGQWIGGISTYVTRPDVNALLGISGNHGFEYVLPQQFCGRPIYVHLIDSSGNHANPILHNSGRSFAC